MRVEFVNLYIFKILLDMLYFYVYVFMNNEER